MKQTKRTVLADKWLGCCTRLFVLPIICFTIKSDHGASAEAKAPLIRTVVTEEALALVRMHLLYAARYLLHTQVWPPGGVWTLCWAAHQKGKPHWYGLWWREKLLRLYTYTFYIMFVICSTLESGHKKNSFAVSIKSFVIIKGPQIRARRNRDW